MAATTIPMTSSGQPNDMLRERLKEAKRSYDRSYYAEHRETISARQRQYDIEHREARRNHKKVFYAENHEVTRNWALKSRYGITSTDVNTIIERQGGCAICGTISWGSRGPCVDHDHETDVIRGVLCDPCNKGLGFFKENPDILITAAEYLMGAE